MIEANNRDTRTLGLLAWLVCGLTGALVVYLLAFALLVNVPGLARAASGVGLTNDRLETIFYPILKLIGG